MFNFINNINNINNIKNNRGINMPSRNIRSTNNQSYSLDTMRASKTVSLFSQPYLDEYNKCYKNIVTLNLQPKGPLAELVKLVKFPPLSEFKKQSSCNKIKQCGLALMSLESCNIGYGKFGEDLMVVDEVPNLISFLVANGYTVDTSITKMFNQSEIRFDTDLGNKLICFVTYNG
jgi:hypothetical protein